MKCHKPRFSWRMIILNLILPLNLAILMFVLFIQVWYLQFDVIDGDIQAKRYLAGPLKQVFSDIPPEEKNIPEWVVMVTLEDGQIYYPFENMETLINDWHLPQEDKLESFLSLMVTKVPSEMSQVTFIYKGKKGLCFYLDDLLPSAFKVLQKPRYLINLFLVTTLFFVLGAAIMYNLRANMKELIRATKRLRDMDFTTPLIPRTDNELSDVFIAFDEMRKELNQTREQGVHFMMSISHDLKTPLTSIKGYLEALRDGVVETPEEKANTLDIIFRKTGLLEDRINEILDLVQDVSAHFYSTGEDFPVKPWLEQLDYYCSEESFLSGRPYSFRDETPEGFQIHGVDTRLSRAVYNLYDNAHRYTPDGLPIHLTAKIDEGTSELILQMEDGGNRVDPFDRERIFDLFFRKDKGRNTRGMGIGLSSVRFVTEIHGGTVVCKDSDLGGACFEIRLPLL